MLEKKSLIKNVNEELNNISCPSCFSKFVFKSLNKNNQILSCSNLKCLFPLNNANMGKFIFDINKDNLNKFLLNLKNLVSEHSYISDTNMEEKLKKYKNEKIESLKDVFSENEIDIQSGSFIFSRDDLFSN